MHTHHHRSVRREMRGFQFCVAPSRCHPEAHGGVTHRDLCRCGATKVTNSTGWGREERGAWVDAISRGDR